MHRAFLGEAEAPATAIEPAPAQPAGRAAAPAGAAAGGTAADAPGAAPIRLDLATLYTSRGLFGASGRIPLPGSSNAHLFVPAGAAGIAMANLAARMGLETTGITLPIASPADTAATRDVRAQAVVAGDAALAQDAEKKLRADDTASLQNPKRLSRPVKASCASPTTPSAAVPRSSRAAMSADRPRRSRRSPTISPISGSRASSISPSKRSATTYTNSSPSVRASGQAAAALYHLDHWMAEAGSGARDVKAEIYTDLADAQLADFARQQIQDRMHVAADVEGRQPARRNRLLRADPSAALRGAGLSLPCLRADLQRRHHHPVGRQAARGGRAPGLGEDRRRATR